MRVTLAAMRHCSLSNRPIPLKHEVKSLSLKVEKSQLKNNTTSHLTAPRQAISPFGIGPNTWPVKTVYSELTLGAASTQPEPL